MPDRLLSLNLVRGGLHALPPALSFSRGSAATCWDANGLLRSLPAGEPRFDHDPLTREPLGLLIEEARTNLIYPARDLSSARWIASSLSVALSSTGIDGTGASATRLTATAGNATLLQAVTASSAAYTFAASIRRVTGSGPVSMTLDGGATWSDIGAQLATATYARPFVTRTLANPGVGFRLSVSGDAIDVDYAQLEAGSAPSSPILTTSAAATRAGDLASLSLAELPAWVQDQGTLVAELDLTPNSGANYLASLWTAANLYGNYLVAYLDGTLIKVGVCANSGATTRAVASAITSSQPFRVGVAWAAGDLALALNGAAVVTAAPATVPQALDTIRWFAQGNPQGRGHLRACHLFPGRLPNALLQALTQ